MTDKREELLVRLHEILQSVATELVEQTEEPMLGAKAFRNTLEFDQSVRPVLLLLDGDEATDPGGFGRGRAAESVVIVSLTPEVYVLVDGTPEDVGPRLNALRAMVVKAILTDDELKTLAHNGDIRYEGCATGLSIGRSMEGEAALNFSLNYALRANTL